MLTARKGVAPCGQRLHMVCPVCAWYCPASQTECSVIYRAILRCIFVLDAQQLSTCRQEGACASYGTVSKTSVRSSRVIPDPKGHLSPCTRAQTVLRSLR